MRQILILIGGLLITLCLHAETYTRVQCKVGNDTITLPVPSKYIIVGRDVAWATDYFRQSENMMIDPTKNRTIKVALLSKGHYESCQKDAFLDSLDCSVHTLNCQESYRLKVSDMIPFVNSLESGFTKILASNDPLKGVKVNNITKEIKETIERAKLIKGAAPIVISKSDRHIIFGTVMPAPTCATLSSMILVEGKLLTLVLWKPELEALAGAVEITKWVEEIEKTTPAESPAKDDSPKS